MAELRLDSPCGDYALLDVGRGRVLERWGEYRVERPERLADAEPRLDHWQADWCFRPGAIGQPGDWQAARPGLAREWPLEFEGQRLHCRLLEEGRLSLQPRQLLCRQWIAARLAGCYHLRRLRVLNLFAGAGALTAAALAAGAEVVHVDASAARLAEARAALGEDGIEYVEAEVLAFLEGALRRRERFELILVNAPRTAFGGTVQAWDSDIDLPRLIKLLPPLVGEDCRGIWLASSDSGWQGEALAQLLGEVLPGRRIEAGPLEVREAAAGCRLPLGSAVRWSDDHDFPQAADRPLDAAQLEARIEPFMIASGAAEAPATALAQLPRSQQDFVLHWVEVVAKTSSGMAFQFVCHAVPALRLMDEAGVEAWLLQCMDAYDTAGLQAAVAAFQQVEDFARERRSRSTGVAFDEVAVVLEAFVQGLNGRRLKLQAGEVCYTDSETLYLPQSLVRLPARQDNFRLYKALAVHQWAQTWYGSWRLSLVQACRHFADAERAMALFHALESLRLDACIARDLPGVAREMAALREQVGHPGPPPHWMQAVERLSRPGARVEDSYALLPDLYALPLPEPLPYQGSLRPSEVEAVRAERLARDREALRLGLLRMEESVRRRLEAAGLQSAEQDAAGRASRLGLRKTPDETMPEGCRYEVTLDGKPLAPPDEVRASMDSILQDLGEIPDDYLFAAGDGGYAPAADRTRDPGEVWKGTYHEEGAFHYNEWDHERQHYRKNWAVLRELEVTPQHDGFVERTLHKHAGLVKSLRRTFEALRGEDKLLKKQVNGDDVDIDALVEAWADSKSGLEMSDRLFTKMHKLERDIAVMFMVDMSGSTKGWINEAEREALVLLCESLETLGDRYAIYGFSGMTRKRCEVYRVKTFDDPYDETVKARISSIQPRDYTRMGVAIRHLSALLNRVEARTRLLITLSDGKPDDYDTYRGAYGIEDTRMALIEAKRDGIHPYCITIDSEARDYLPHMYGAVNYTVIDEVRKLPLKVSDIYRRLTS
ncbi:hypothetical protein QVG61_01640 [Thiohalobacter sp. IOR34]|uniref:nitric oxide reductase activation protein NorD n=1 Tax=Thiohalobacter sp. IOR34 TaxID=3057176 RepID=UPI0025AF4E57|nr:VWA domain-containing protein [Thiohalobacter sp. IOR34]WJW75816.1 hypothetical protein QVG61_01640 [Thiohalobacter sp. IOR34]